MRNRFKISFCAWIAAVATIGTSATALAGAKFSADKRVEVSVDGNTCKSGLFRSTKVMVTEHTIEIDCRRLFKAKGYTRKLRDLDNFQWESSLFRGRLTAKEHDGREFYIDVKKKELSNLRAALKGHMEGDDAK